MVTTKMNWSGINVIHFGRKSRFGPDQFILVVTITFWLWPNHYGQVQINLVRQKPFWTNQNCFGHIEGQGIRCLLPKAISVEDVSRQNSICWIFTQQNHICFWPCFLNINNTKFLTFFLSKFDKFFMFPL